MVEILEKHRSENSGGEVGEYFGVLGTLCLKRAILQSFDMRKLFKKVTFWFRNPTRLRHLSRAYSNRIGLTSSDQDVLLYFKDDKT